MTGYIAFFKKELLENVRTYKLLILLLVFFIFGMTGPLIAKLTPDLLAQFMPDGMSVQIADPTAFDAWSQFFKNISQLALIVMVILFSGTLGSELSRGTLINMLTKGLPRRSVILSKFTSMTLLWTAALAIASLVSYGYTVYLFPGDGIVNLLFSVFCLWLFGLFLISALMFAAVLTKNNYGCLLVTGAVVLICMLCSIIPAAHKYNPLSLSTDNIALIKGAVSISSLDYSILITVVLSVVFLVSSVLIFRRRLL